jgi:hypothetical protein
MANRIRDVHVVNYGLDPHETELRIHVELDEVTPTTQIKGRLMGPRNVYASTVEVAYPMREVERGAGIVLRVVIPEPSWWEPKTPFLYQGPLELWQNGLPGERCAISHGIRSMQLTPKGLRLNGRPCVLRVKQAEPSCSEAELRALQSAGVNAVITSIAESDGLELWNRADRVGLFVIGYSEQSSAAFVLRRNELEKHPCAIAWVFSHDIMTHDIGLQRPSTLLYGEASAGSTFPPHASFVLGHDQDLPDVTLPKMLVVKKLPESLPTRPDVIGWIELP